MPQKTQRSNPDSRDDPPVGCRQHPADSIGHIGEIALSAECMEAHERARYMAERYRAESQSYERHGNSTMPPHERDADRSQRDEWDNNHQGVRYVCHSQRPFHLTLSYPSVS